MEERGLVRDGLMSPVPTRTRREERTDLNGDAVPPHEQ